MQNSISSQWDEVTNTIDEFASDMAGILGSVTDSVGDRLLLQTQSIVKPKLKSLPEISVSKTIEILQSVDRAIISSHQTANSGITNSINSFVDESIASGRAEAQQIWDNTKKAMDINSCKIEPLFTLPNLLNLQLGVDLSIDLIGSLDFNTRSCR